MDFSYVPATRPFPDLLDRVSDLLCGDWVVIGDALQNFEIISTSVFRPDDRSHPRATFFLRLASAMI
jgi:hypothetical protein